MPNKYKKHTIDLFTQCLHATFTASPQAANKGIAINLFSLI